MNHPLVSTVIPTFNRAALIGRAIDSVLNQTYPHVEVVVVDDGSTDNTGELIQQMYGDDRRVRYLHQANQGVSTARNTGMAAAQGDFVALLDSDDVWCPHKLELQVGVLQALPHVGMVWTDMEAIDANGEVSHGKYLRTMYDAYKWFDEGELFSESYHLTRLLPELSGIDDGVTVSAGDIFSQMFMGNLVHTSTVLLRRERLDAVGGFDVGLKMSGEDYDFHQRTCREGPVAFIDLSTIRYQCECEDQLTHSRYSIHLARNGLKTMTRTYERDRKRINLPSSMISAALSEAYAWAGETELDCGELSDARRHLGYSLWYKPTQLHTGVFFALSLLPFGLGNHLRAGVRRMKSGAGILMTGRQ